MASKGKDFPLSITLRSVDRATAGLKRVNDQLEGTFKPFKNLREQLGGLSKNLGLPRVAEGLRDVMGKVKGLALGIGALAAAGGVGIHELRGLVDEFDELGATSGRLGLSVDALAQLRFAAQKSDVEIEELDGALESFNKSLGQAKAGTGRMAGFLKKVSPELLKQIKHAKGTEEAFDLMANAMVKLKDPAKRAAFATAAFGTAGQPMINMLGRGATGIEDLKKEFFRLAGSQQEAADAAGSMDDAMKDTHAAMTAVKASILVGVAPAFVELAHQVTEFFVAHRAQIAAWMKAFGEQLPGRIKTLMGILREVAEIFRAVGRAIGWMVDKVGGAENAVKLLIGAWAGFKALKLVYHLAMVTKGLRGMGDAAGAAKSAVEAAAAAGQGGGGAAGAAAGGATKGKGGKPSLLGALPILGAIATGAEAGAMAIDSDQEEAMRSRDRGAALQQDLRRVRDRGDRISRRMLAQTLRSGGFVTSGGRFADNVENRRALLSGTEVSVADPMRANRELQATIAQLNEILADKSLVRVEFKDAPPGTRVTHERGSAVDLNVGYQGPR